MGFVENLLFLPAVKEP